MNLAQRTVRSVSWNVVATTARLVILFGRSVLLARLLPVDVFGVYAFATAVVGLSVTVPKFGMAAALLHRAPESEDVEQAARIHFTLKSAFTVLWVALVIGGAFFLTEGPVRLALIVLASATALMETTQTARTLLTRRVHFRRLAVLDVLNAVATTAVALGLVWGGATLWALLATDIATALVFVIGLYLWRPVWRPRFGWSLPVVRYYLGFGSRHFLTVVLTQALDRVDDLWAGFYLGATPLGFYSRAYTFATYPRSVLAGPVNAVAGGTYAELKGDKQRLSKAFFRTNALLVRTGFFLAGLMALIAPEFILLLLGAKWLPMVNAFRLMLIFTLFDPIKQTVSNLFVAVGRPDQAVRARALQLAILVAGLFLLGPPLGIEGVALAVDLMLVAGIATMLRQAREHIRFSARRLFIRPALALLTGLVIGALPIALLSSDTSPWVSGGTKSVLFSVGYGLVLLLVEREEIIQMISYLMKTLHTKDYEPEAASGS